MSDPLPLSRRERQILEIVYRLGQATAAEILDEMDDPPTYTTVRGLLRVLERKGHLRHDDDGVRYVYSPVQSKRTKGVSALTHVVRTFFDGSPSNAVASLLGSNAPLSEAELRRLSELLAQHRKKGRR